MQSEVGHVSSFLADQPTRDPNILASVIGWLNTWKTATSPASESAPANKVPMQRNSVLSALLYAIADLTRTIDPDVILQGICDAIVDASDHTNWYGHGIANLNRRKYFQNYTPEQRTNIPRRFRSNATISP